MSQQTCKTARIYWFTVCTRMQVSWEKSYWLPKYRDG